MLADKDRIFKNLYGHHGWDLAHARARGAWDGTKAILDKGRDGIVNDLAAGRTPKPGPQVDRHLSAPIGGENTLTDQSNYQVTKQAAAPPPADVATADPKHG